MAKRRRDNGQKAQHRRSKEGRGIGTGADYKPYLYIHDVPSIGLASRVWGWKTNRVHHFLSRLELKFFYTLEWSPFVIDIREQFPLDLDETLAIADQLGIRHPRDPKKKDYSVMTSDFVITLKKGFVSEEIIRSVKYKSDLENERVKEKLAIERMYWTESRGLTWDVVTEDKIDMNVVANVEWVHGHREIRQLLPLATENVIEIEAKLSSLVTESLRPLRDLTNECDRFLGLEPGTSLRVVRYLIANRWWKVDMSTRIRPTLPLTLAEPSPRSAGYVRRLVG
jgi:TnsA endonuclease N terminal/TnsA endonuclease C terminal